MGAAAGTLLATGLTTGYSFYQSSEQKKMQREAESAAKMAMDEAKRKLDVNFYKSIGIQKEPYELEREAVLANQALTIQAGTESKRGVATVANAVNMANNSYQRNIAGAMGKDMMNLDMAIADQNTALNNQKINLDLGTAQGAQLAARNREMLSNQAFMQGMEGVTSLTGQLASMAPLYGYNKDAAQLATLEQKYNAAIQNNAIDPNYRKAITDANGNLLPFDQALKNSMMTPTQFEDFLNNQQSQPNMFGLDY